MKRALVSFGIVVALASVRAAGEEPGPKPEAWVSVTTMKGSWRVRVDGGPAKQVAAPPEEDKRWKFIHAAGEFGRGTQGVLSPDGKKAIYHEPEPDFKASKKITDYQLIRIVLADADGKNPKVMLNNVIWWPGFRICPDGKGVVCGAAEAKEKWFPFRVSFDGSKPAKLSETVSVEPPVIIPLLNDRYLYCPMTKKEEVKNGPFTTLVTRGPAILIDGKKETVLIKETATTPTVSQDATKMAVDRQNEKGEHEVELTDLKTGKKDEIPLKVFNKDWKVRAYILKFSPDGKALLVSFRVGGGVVIRQKGPLPGDEAEEHFGVIWLDGRKDRTALFRIDQPRDKNGYFASIDELEWSSAPPEKKK